MKETITTMQRQEKKYVLYPTQYHRLCERILPYLQPDEYYESHIYNLYLDNEANELITRSIMKPVYKEKLRIRSYREVGVDTQQEVFLEVKKKCQGVVCKRRIAIPYADVLNSLKQGKLAMSGQIAEELSYAISRYRVVPNVFIGYDRLSYKGKEDDSLRITFDSHIRSRFNHLSLQDHPDNQELFEHHEVLMEIKAQQALPLWLIQVLSELHIYPESFSKVAQIYQKYRGGCDHVYQYTE